MARFYKLENADGKVWLMPERHMRTAMELYQPNGRNGKLLKRWFPLLHGFPLIRKFVRAERVSDSLSPELEALLHRLWGVERLEYAVFFGSPGLGRKSTMQVFRGKRILGYVKMTDSEEVSKLFVRETETLRLLLAKGVKGIPEALFCGSVDGHYTFIQSTEKTLHSTVLNEFTPQHLAFLRDLCGKTSDVMPFEVTALKADMNYLREIMPLMETRLQCMFSEAIALVEGHYGAQREFCYMHGDFTPWNIYVEKGELHPFDFEYASDGYPAYMDMVHFYLQIMIQVEKKEVEAVFEGLNKRKSAIPAEDRNFLILAYLLHMFALYSRWFNGRFPSTEVSFIVWTGLIDKYIYILNNE